MILLDRTDVHAMCPVCHSVVFTNGEVRDGCEQRDGCMLTSARTIEHSRVFVFRLTTGQTVAVDLEDKTKVIGIAWRMDKSGHIIGTINGKTVMLHRLVTGTAQAYNTRAKEDYGEFAVLNARQPFLHRGAEGDAEEESL
jgi:hypothetical protein